MMNFDLLLIFDVVRAPLAYQNQLKIGNYDKHFMTCWLLQIKHQTSCTWWSRASTKIFRHFASVLAAHHLFFRSWLLLLRWLLVCFWCVCYALFMVSIEWRCETEGTQRHISFRFGRRRMMKKRKTHSKFQLIMLSMSGFIKGTHTKPYHCANSTFFALHSLHHPTRRGKWMNYSIRIFFQTFQTEKHTNTPKTIVMAIFWLENFIWFFVWFRWNLFLLYQRHK